MEITTTGTITADLSDGSKFRGVKQANLYRDPMYNFWVANSADVKDDWQSFLIFLRIPVEGDVTNKEYSIDSDYSNLTTAKATWIDVQGAGWAPSPAYSGKIIVTINTKQQTVTGTFNFTARLPENKELVVSNGSVDMKDFDEVRATSKAEATGTFTATLEGGAYKEYAANQFQLAARPGNPEVGLKVPHWWAWSQNYSDGVPNRSLDIVNILFARDLGPGTYDLALFKDEIFVSYLEMYPGAAVYPAKSGKLVVEEVPANGSSHGLFKGRLEFISEEASNGRRITFKNGVFTFDSNPQTP
ncbi:hypothetical protein [Pseudomonas arsenicoxydans]|uniref:Uncharacterized protein n=1 Tax=Pseudomonas arsenicoxydans TaxID=702115 RepID=A0A502HKZ5_9PSED|nr:hypothetical protein [Pseudomonas arsenicoxydans]TPG75351.1 hypothetical protein EAH78_21070 [Pseudomonas arsenicoxydans]